MFGYLYFTTNINLIKKLVCLSSKIIIKKVVEILKRIRIYCYDARYLKFD